MSVAPAELLSVVGSLFATNVRAGERVLVVTSVDQHPAIVAAFRRCAELSPAKDWILRILDLPPTGLNYRHPVALIKEAVAADLTIVATTLAFPRAFDDLTVAVHRAGRRLVLLNNAPPEQLVLGAASSDPAELDRLTNAVAARVSNSRHIRIETASGTDLGLTVSRPCYSLTGTADERSKFGSFPSGEAMLAVEEGTATGTFVATDFGQIVYLLGNGPALGLLEDPIRLTINRGAVVDVSGGRAAARLSAALEAADNESRMVAELGIGTNPCARAIDAVENKFRLGTAHIALGANSTIGWASSDLYGGVLRSGLHIDLVAAAVTITLDGVVLLREGVLAPGI